MGGVREKKKKGKKESLGWRQAMTAVVPRYPPQCHSSPPRPYSRHRRPLAEARRQRTTPATPSFLLQTGVGEKGESERGGQQRQRQQWSDW